MERLLRAAPSARLRAVARSVERLLRAAIPTPRVARLARPRAVEPLAARLRRVVHSAALLPRRVERMEPLRVVARTALLLRLVARSEPLPAAELSAPPRVAEPLARLRVARSGPLPAARLARLRAELSALLALASAASPRRP